MSKSLPRYEMMVIFKPLLPDDVRKGAHKSIVDLVEKTNGNVLSADVWGKRYLAYKIKSHDEGYYIVYDLELSVDGIEEFRVQTGRITEVLRFMLTRIEKPEMVTKKLNKKEIEI